MTDLLMNDKDIKANKVIPKILSYPHEALKTKSIECSLAEGIEIGNTLLHAAAASSRGIYGLAANQIGITKRVFIFTKLMPNLGERIFINPKITSSGIDTKEEKEFCASFPEEFGVRVSRIDTIRLGYITKYGDWRESIFYGLNARCVLHELDHLNGTNIIAYANKKEMRQYFAAQANVIKTKSGRRYHDRW